MKWEGRRQSENVEDRRGLGTTGKVVAGGGAVGIIFLLIQLFLGGDDGQIMQQLENQMNQGGGSQAPTELTAEEKVVGQFISTVLADTEDIWKKLFQEKGMVYKEPKLVLFKDVTRSACGGASGSTGPFYCPGDETVYIDMSFFNTLKQRFGAKGGDFAIAYVIAHEIGHHVQNQMGILRETQNLRQRLNEAQGNQVQVATELQADFYAGVWARQTDNREQILEPGDIESAISAAEAVGDDNIQKRSQGYVNQEGFTHGSSAQRKEWFMKGYNTGDIRQGDTFNALLK